MLTKRTNILFDENIFNMLLALAKFRNTSIGELVRLAVLEKYFSEHKNEKIIRACQLIKKIRKKFKKINYKELIDHGRKY